MDETTPPPFGETPMNLDDLIADFANLLVTAESEVAAAADSAEEAENEAENVKGIDAPSGYSMQDAIDTIAEMQAALERAEEPDLSSVTDAIAEAREKTDELRSTVAAMRGAFERLVAAVRDGATVAPAAPSPLDLAREVAAAAEAEAREAEADFDRAYRRRNDALHAAAHAAAEVRRLEAAR